MPKKHLRRYHRPEHKNHNLKIAQAPFNAVLKGRKRFEIRKNDRDFKVGDLLTLLLFIENLNLPGPEIQAEVTHIEYGPAWGLPEDLCVMSIKVLSTLYC